MAFKKLPEELIINLQNQGYTDFLPNQKKIFSKIKEGRNLVIEHPTHVGFSTLIALASVAKVPVPEEGSPRVIIICANDEDANAMHDRLKKLSFHMDLTIDLAIERGNQIQQRNDIFDGTEIVVGTTKRIYDLYIQNGINLNKIRLFAIDNGKETFVKNNPGYILRLADSLPKCQIILGTSEINKKITHFVDTIEHDISRYIIKA
ncbi:MAG: superfamily II DNA/RNA helicase [Lentimonas sp.]|jgi:superfamily II DNA/RNA helicase